MGLNELAIAYQNEPCPKKRNELFQLITAGVEGMIQKQIRRYSADGYDRDDLRQVALIALLRALNEYDATKGVSFFTFCYWPIINDLKKVVRYECSPRRRQKRVSLADVQVADDTPTPAEVVIAKEKTENSNALVASILNSLTGEETDIATSYMHGEPISSIAQRYGMTHQGIRRRLAKMGGYVTVSEYKGE